MTRIRAGLAWTRQHCPYQQLSMHPDEPAAGIPPAPCTASLPRFHRVLAAEPLLRPCAPRASSRLDRKPNRLVNPLKVRSRHLSHGSVAVRHIGVIPRRRSGVQLGPIRMPESETISCQCATHPTVRAIANITVGAPPRVGGQCLFGSPCQRVTRLVGGKAFPPAGFLFQCEPVGLARMVTARSRKLCRWTR